MHWVLFDAFLIGAQALQGPPLILCTIILVSHEYFVEKMTNDVISFKCCKTFAALVVSFENFPQLLRVVTCPRRLC